VNELIAVQQASPNGSPPWTVARDGRRTRGLDGAGRTSAIEAGLRDNPGCRLFEPETPESAVLSALHAVHDREYVALFDRLASDLDGEPVLVEEWSAPGVPADTPIFGGGAVVARAALGTAVATGLQVAAGAQIAYALCRPPGHHAGPRWMGGYCYLNNAAAAAVTLLEAGFDEVGILDLDFHYGNGTAAIAAHLEGVRFESLHASTVEHFPWQATSPLSDRQKLTEFERPPSLREYLGAVDRSLARLVPSCDALVVSLGYDIVEGDPHGDWSLPPTVFTAIGRRLLQTGLPACVVQEGGYAYPRLAECARAFAAGITRASTAELPAVGSP
jgi:acetoin utilization deacetylase AcuC-like enzyme